MKKEDVPVAEAAPGREDAPKERPILFSAPMVRAILEGRKTQTRRTMKFKSSGPHTLEQVLSTPDSAAAFIRHHCPYGQPGDRLWVRERMRVLDIAAPTGVQAIRVQYEADRATSDWILWPGRLKGKPEICKCLSYGGFREASRLTLEVTGIRVERLQDITEADAIAEGIERINDLPVNPLDFTACWKDYTGSTPYWNSPIDSYHSLWESINGPGSWDANPWVWVVEFRKAERSEAPEAAEGSR